MAVWEDARVARGMPAQLAARQQLLDEGAERVGWKVALGMPENLEQLGTDGPLVGFLTSQSLLPDGAPCAVDAWTKPALEPEIAVHLGVDVPAGASREAAAAAVAALGVAIELADLDRPPVDLEDVVARNLYHRHVLLGPRRRATDGGATSGLTASVRQNEVEVRRREAPHAFPPAIPDLVRHVADYLEAFGECLRGGDVIITGAVVPLVWVEPGDRVTYALDPIGRLDVRF